MSDARVSPDPDVDSGAATPEEAGPSTGTTSMEERKAKMEQLRSRLVRRVSLSLLPVAHDPLLLSLPGTSFTAPSTTRPS
jgi:hypothetical protein